MEQTPPQHKPLSQEDFRAAIERVGRRYEASTIDVAALAGPIANPAVTELSAFTVEGLEDFADAMRTWLAYPTITDSLPGHAERRELRSQLGMQYGRSFHDLYQRNKLKGGGLFALATRFEILSMELRHIDSDKISEIRDIVASAPDVSNYEEMTLEQKLGIVRTLESLSVRLLKFITAPEAV